MRKDFKRRTDTNVGEDRTHRKIREDRRFAQNEAEWLCPLTHSTFFGVKLGERRPVNKAAYNQGFGRGGKTTA